MTISHQDFAARLDERMSLLGRPERVLLAFSGGRDSSVLLHLVSDWARRSACEILAIHVNHHLQESADDWQAHCERAAAALGVRCLTLDVAVATDNGRGLEANAREARYSALRAVTRAGDWLLTAHHADDQAETVLLNLLRGSGVAGVRGVAGQRPFGDGLLLRPLLEVTAAAIADYARAQAISWVDDHSNTDEAHDRNYLRAAVLPPLRERWPAVAGSFGRSAAHAREASLLLDELAAIDLESCGDAARLALGALQALSVPRRRHLLRYACRQLGLATPPYAQLGAILQDLVPAREDAMPVVRWATAEARRHRDHLYLLAAAEHAAVPPAGTLDCDAALDLGAGQGSLFLQATAAGGIRAATARAGLDVRYRSGGERLRPAGHAHHRRLKSLLQEAAVVPWMRDRIPLLYSAGELVAAGDLWVADEFHATRGFRVLWQQRPAIF